MRPEFLQGRDHEVVASITAEIERVDGVELLDVDPGAATNRTVVTFVGTPEAAEEAAFRAIARAAELIDCPRTGEHPRMGATDVCPFVPIEGTTLDDCVEIARRLGARVGADLGIPVYLYEYAALDGRRSLADARSGEYESLAARSMRRILGPPLNPSAGATAIGARRFLIAYNVNLETRPIASWPIRSLSAVRTLGTATRDADGKIIKNEHGKTVFAPGRFEEVKGVGWYIDEYDRAQVSLNLTDTAVSPMHEVFQACREEASLRGMRVTGSEIVGLVPLDAMLAAGDYFLEAQGRTTAIPEHDRVRAAVVSLGLDEITPFDPAAKIVEYRFRGEPVGLVHQTLAAFADELSKTPPPGGGSVAAPWAPFRHPCRRWLPLLRSRRWVWRRPGPRWKRRAATLRR